MSRSRYRPRLHPKRADKWWWFETLAWKRRREDIATGMVRTRIYRKKKHKSYPQLVHEWRNREFPMTECPPVPVMVKRFAMPSDEALDLLVKSFTEPYDPKADCQRFWEDPKD